MADPSRIEYKPTFNPLPWRDNIDLVRADGANSFNERFREIEEEFRRIGQVVEQIGGTFRHEEDILLSPQLTGRPNQQSWTYEFGYAISAIGVVSMGGMALALPHRSIIQVLQAVVYYDPDPESVEPTLTIELVRRKVKGNNTALGNVGDHEKVDRIAAITLNQDASGGPIFTPEVGPASVELARVDAEQFVYFITAEQKPSGSAADQATRVFALRVKIIRS